MSDDPEKLQFTFTHTQDWFSHNINNWKSLFPLVQCPNPRVLEIGSWEGRSGVFLLTHLCSGGGEIVCIDHFDLLGTPAGRERHVKVRHNLTLTGRPFRIMDEFSVPALMVLLEEEISAKTPGFDWIYIDGSHEADDTFLDGELVWRLARKGAIVIFDDYNWDKEPKDSVHHPKRGIDAFMSLHEGEYERLSSPLHYQMILRKTSDMRIGFLVKQKVERNAHAFGYGIHLVLALDTQYAMPAAVTIRSAIENTPGRVTVYVIDCGISEEDKGKLKSSVPKDSDTTLVFLGLPADSVAADMGAVWAKVDMLGLLPVERALYLDSDVLVRADLRQLWETDLKGKMFGAVTDVGYPQGHEDIARQPYFNAGVLLMDLAKMRDRIEDVNKLAREMREAKFRDQDCLNIHFSDDWMPLHLRWNAQGLGTYALLSSKDRDLLSIEDMSNPHIVHFTGPVNPGLVDVLNPYLQPCTAKPWGYSGAPGHPYAEEWWATLDKTAWSGMRTSDVYQRLCGERKEEAIQTAIQQFREKVR